MVGTRRSCRPVSPENPIKTAPTRLKVQNTQETNNEPSQDKTGTSKVKPSLQEDRDTDKEYSHTPPKQRKGESSKLLSPTSLMKNLGLNSPTERSKSSKKQNAKGKGNLKRTLISSTSDESTEENNANAKDLGKSTKLTENDSDKAIVTKYQSARRALHSSSPLDLPGREKEIEEMNQFIQEHLNNETSASVYISGPPGTGKTAMLNLIFKQTEVTSKVKSIYINCTSIKSASAVYSRIIKELKLTCKGKSEKEYLTVIEKHLKQRHKTILLVLDEIDQLETKNQSILYTIFEWPAKKNSRMLLVGIANALDLTDRLLPRLQSRCELKPKLMHFAPYTKDQIITIFKSRLEAAGVLEIFSPVALQMLASKVAAVSGDVRRALDIGRRVVELIDDNQQQDVLKSVENLVDDMSDSEPKPADQRALKTVSHKEVFTVLEQIYSTSQSLTTREEDTFPLQQKIVVCTLLLMMKKAKNKVVTLGKLHEVYTKICKKRNLLAIDISEFANMCTLIEARGIMKIAGKNDIRLRKVNLEWNEAEVAEALYDKVLMEGILRDDSCL